MTMRILAAATLALALDASSPRTAHADWLLTPYLGVTFGGDTPNQQVNYGLSAAFLGAGIVGVEVDAALTPNFFDSDSGLIEDSNVSTLMANLMVAAPSGTPVRPYASGGAGIIRSKATSVGNFFDLEDTSFGVNIGGGVLAEVGTRVGIRGDVRYFRALQDSDDGGNLDLDLAGFNFWRGTLGVTFRF